MTEATAEAALETPAWPLEHARCMSCGRRYFPVMDLDPCGHDAVVLEPLTGAGTIYSWTRAWSSEDSSQLLALVDFYEGELRVAAPVVDAHAVAIGSPARLEHVPDAGGDGPRYVIRLASL